MTLHTLLRFSNQGAEPYSVVIEPWAAEYPIPTGVPCEVVAIHPTEAPTFTAWLAKGKLIVRVNSDSSFEFWQAGQLLETRPMPNATTDGSTLANPPVSASDSSVLPFGKQTLYAPAHLEEGASGELILQSSRRAFLPLGSFCVFLLILAIVCISFVVTVLAIGINRPWVLPGDAIRAAIAMGVLGILSILAFIRLVRFIVKMRSEHGPISFDHISQLLLFGPRAQRLSRPLSDISAIQVLPTSALKAIQGAPLPFAKQKKSWISRLLDKLVSRLKVTQLNLVFKDGSRLNLVSNDRKSSQAIADRLAAALSLPLIGLNTSEG